MKKKSYESDDININRTEASDGTITSAHPHGTFSSFRNPAFRLYFGGMAGHWSSMNIQQVARSLLLYRITGSGAILGTMSLAHAVPMVLLSLIGGDIADRVQKKKILLWGQVLSAINSLAIALALTLGYLSSEHPNSWWLLMVSATIQGIIMGIIMPSRQAIIPEIVDKSQMMNAISLNNMGMNTFQILAPAATGFITATFDFDAAYYIMTAMFIMATVCVSLLPNTRPKTVTRTGNSALNNIAEGLRYVRSEKTILLILIFTLTGTVCTMPYRHLMPMFTEDILKVGDIGMGILLSVAGFGALLGSLFLASLPNRKRGLYFLGSGLLAGLALLGFSFSQWWYPSLFIVFFLGVGQTGQMTMGNSLTQYYTNPVYRGRVMSFYIMGFGLASVGAFFAGILSEAIGIQWAVGVMAIILITASISAFMFSSRLRKLD